MSAELAYILYFFPILAIPKRAETHSKWPPVKSNEALLEIKKRNR